MPGPTGRCHVDRCDVGRSGVRAAGNRQIEIGRGDGWVEGDVADVPQAGAKLRTDIPRRVTGLQLHIGIRGIAEVDGEISDLDGIAWVSPSHENVWAAAWIADLRFCVNRRRNGTNEGEPDKQTSDSEMATVGLRFHRSFLRFGL